MATHRDFLKLMADIEIYVNGIAAMQVQNFTSLVDLTRVEIIERYQPGDDDRVIKALGAAHISEDTYFSHIVHADIDGIIREVHKGDNTIIPNPSDRTAENNA